LLTWHTTQHYERNNDILLSTFATSFQPYDRRHFITTTDKKQQTTNNNQKAAKNKTKKQSKLIFFLSLLRAILLHLFPSVTFTPYPLHQTIVSLFALFFPL
jgi:hypothetical protein